MRIKIINISFICDNKFNITCYDHISYNESIARDISKLLEEDETVNMCIFSQSLMGSNWKDYFPFCNVLGG